MRFTTDPTFWSSPEFREWFATASRGQLRRWVGVEKPEGWPDDLPFVHGPKPRPGPRSYNGIHVLLRERYPKTGVCEHCGAEAGPSGHGGTQYAFKRHPEPCTLNRDDYWELCSRCHKTLDTGKDGDEVRLSLSLQTSLQNSDVTPGGPG